MPSSADHISAPDSSVVPVLRAADVAPTTRIQAWRRSVILLVAAFLLIVALFGQTFASMISIWRSGTYSHGFLVLPICCWLIWRERGRLLRSTPAPTFTALLAIVLLALAWLVGELAQANLIRQIAAVALVPTLFWAMLGLRTTSIIWFSLLYLFFAVPAGDSLIPPLQDFTAWFTVSALQATGVPALLEERLIYVSSGTWEVAEACSGLRYLISSVALGTLFAYVYYRCLGRRLAFVGASVIIPILANGVRAYSIVLFAHTISKKIAVGIDHVIYGGLFFFVVMLCLFALALVWPERGQPIRSAADDFSEVSGRRANQSLAASTIILLLSVLILSGTRAWAYSITNSIPGKTSELKTLSVSPPWKRVEASQQPPIANFSNTDFQSSTDFSDGSHTVRVYLAYYGYQRPNAELIRAENGLDESGRRRILQRHGLVVGSLPLNQAVVASAAGNQLAWYWYWVDGRPTARPSMAKMLRAKAELLKQRRDAAAIFISTDIESSSAEAEGVLRAFLQDARLAEIFGTSSPAPTD